MARRSRSFQLGGNFGTAAGPLLAAFIVVPGGQGSVAWFCLAALCRHGDPDLGQPLAWAIIAVRQPAARRSRRCSGTARGRVIFTLACWRCWCSPRNIYMAKLFELTTPSYVIERFDGSIRDSQMLLFLFLGAAAVGQPSSGGPIGDRIGTKSVIWVSILGVLPFTLMLPYARPVLDRCAHRDHRHGAGLGVSGNRRLRAGNGSGPGGADRGPVLRLRFGMGGIAAAVLGQVADVKGIVYVYMVCFLPAVLRAADDLPCRRKAGGLTLTRSGTFHAVKALGMAGDVPGRSNNRATCPGPAVPASTVSGLAGTPYQPAES